MSTVAIAPFRTAANLVHRLGDIPLKRILMRPPPGMATVADVIDLLESDEKCLCELVDGVLIEKILSALKSYVGGVLTHYLIGYLDVHNHGVAFGPNCPYRIGARQVRLPDISIVAWERLPQRLVPRAKLLRSVPELAVEIYCRGNTRREMQRKLSDYFNAGVRQVWIIYPVTESAEIYTSQTKFTIVKSDQSLHGGDILPGFELPLAKLFERVEKPKKKKR